MVLGDATYVFFTVTVGAGGVRWSFGFLRVFSSPFGVSWVVVFWAVRFSSFLECYRF